MYQSKRAKRCTFSILRLISKHIHSIWHKIIFSRILHHIIFFTTGNGQSIYFKPYKEENIYLQKLPPIDIKWYSP